jgi:hypothetical protein
MQILPKSFSGDFASSDRALASLVIPAGAKRKAGIQPLLRFAWISDRRCAPPGMTEAREGFGPHPDVYRIFRNACAY